MTVPSRWCPIQAPMTKATRVIKQPLIAEAKPFALVVQPGVRNLAISEAVAPLGLYYAPDPSSQMSCRTSSGSPASSMRRTK